MAQGLPKTVLAGLLAGVLAACVTGGCAGEPFSSTSNSGAAGKGSAATGGASGGVSATGASGGVAQAGRGGTGGGAGASARGGSGGAAQGGSSGVGVSSGGVPPLPDIPRNDLILWLAADRGVTHTDGAVSKWLDQSQTHADAVQGVVGARPRRVEAAQNGLPVLEFDGVDDWLGLPDGFEDLSTGLSFFAVIKLALRHV